MKMTLQQARTIVLEEAEALFERDGTLLSEAEIESAARHYAEHGAIDE